MNELDIQWLDRYVVRSFFLQRSTHTHLQRGKRTVQIGGEISGPIQREQQVTEGKERRNPIENLSNEMEWMNEDNEKGEVHMEWLLTKGVWVGVGITG